MHPTPQHGLLQKRLSSCNIRELSTQPSNQEGRRGKPAGGVQQSGGRKAGFRAKRQGMRQKGGGKKGMKDIVFQSNIF
jgi:hypothetical protein